MKITSPLWKIPTQIGLMAFEKIIGQKRDRARQHSNVTLLPTKKIDHNPTAVVVATTYLLDAAMKFWNFFRAVYISNNSQWPCYSNLFFTILIISILHL